MLEVTAHLKQGQSSEEVLILLEALMQEADAVAKTKQQAPSKIIGDWQSTETLYAVVDAEAFHVWRKNVKQHVWTYYEDAEALWYGFDELCRFPQFVEVLEGQKFLRALGMHPQGV